MEYVVDSVGAMQVGLTSAPLQLNVSACMNVTLSSIAQDNGNQSFSLSEFSIGITIDNSSIIELWNGSTPLKTLESQISTKSVSALLDLSGISHGYLLDDGLSFWDKM